VIVSALDSVSLSAVKVDGPSSDWNFGDFMNEKRLMVVSWGGVYHSRTGAFAGYLSHLRKNPQPSKYSRVTNSHLDAVCCTESCKVIGSCEALCLPDLDMIRTYGKDFL
jgi:hypothetical protein